MAFSDEDLAAFVARLRQRADVRAELRDVLLGEEAARLVQAVSGLADRVAALGQAQERTEQRLGALAEAQQRTEQRLGALADAQARTEGHLRELASWMSELAGHVDKLRGESVERHYRERGTAYFAPIARRLKEVRLEDVDDLLEDAVDRGVLDKPDADEVRWADAVFWGRRRHDGVGVYLVVEASAGVDVHDVNRAHDRAELLARATDSPAVGVVAGERVDSVAARAAEDLSVWQVVDGRVVAPGDVD